VRKLLLATLIGTLVGGVGIQVTAESQPTFKAAVDMVPISAIVRDARGRLVTTLNAADFEVLDKGERRSILAFQTDDAMPITLAVLVDVSGSMRMGPKMAFVREVLRHVQAGLRRGIDEVGLFTFDATLQERRPFTALPDSFVDALGSTLPFGTTSLYDAIADTARRVEQHGAQRRAVLVITDGDDTSSSLEPAEVSGLASSIDVPVYVVAAVPSVDHPLNAMRNGQPSVDLRELAMWTGGELVWVTTATEAVLRSQQILSELRHQYLIAIESAPQGEWRPIDVRVRDRKMTVRARSGYFSRPVSQ
jgi:Ca-activated chloride channel family protein